MKNLADETGLSKVANGVRHAGKAIAKGITVATLAMAAAGTQAGKWASDLEQSSGGVESVFKKSSSTIKKWAQGANQDVGLTENAYNQLATILGSQLKNMGISMDQVTGKTGDLITLGADLAATFGGPTSEAVAAISALMRGEADPIERYGVSIKQSDINARMAAKGLNGLSGEAAKQAQIMTTLELLSEQTADAQGQFAREANTAAGATERLKARLQDKATALGTYLLPAYTKIVTAINAKVEPAFNKLTAFIESTVKPAIKDLTAWYNENSETINSYAARVASLAGGALALLGRVLLSTGKALVSTGKFLKDNYKWISALVGPILAVVAAWMAYQKALKIIAAAQAAYRAALLAMRGVQTAYAMGTYGMIAGNATLATTLAGLAGALKTKTIAMGAATAAGAKSLAQSAAQAAAWTAQKVALVASKVAMGAATAAQWAMNAAMTANPIGLVIAAIAALVAGLVWFFTQTELGQKLWGKFTDALGAGWQKVLDFFAFAKEAISFTFSAIWAAAKKYFSYTPLGMIIKNWDKITAFFRKFKDSVGKIFAGAINWLKSAGKNIVAGLSNGATERFRGLGTWFKDRKRVILALLPNPALWLASIGRKIIGGMGTGTKERFSSVRSWFRSIPSTIRGYFSNASTILRSAGMNIINGLWNGLKAKWESVKSWTRGLGRWIANNKGPKAYDLALLKPAGKWIMTGLGAGLENQLPHLRRTLRDIAGDIAATDFEAPGVTTTTARHRSNSAQQPAPQRVYNITVNALTATEEVGRRVVESIKRFERSGGVI